MENQRYGEFIEIIGAPGRGKTKLLVDSLNLKVKQGDRALVVLPDQSEEAWFPYFPVIEAEDLEQKFDPNFKGICLIEWEEKLTFPFLLDLFKTRKLKNLNLVLDDPTYAASPNQPEKELIRILSRKRQYCLDVWSNAHSYDQVPKQFFQYITIYGLMFTSAEIKNRLGEVPHHVPIKKRVDSIAGQRKDNNPNYHYCEFFYKNGEKL